VVSTTVKQEQGILTQDWKFLMFALGGEAYQFRVFPDDLAMLQLANMIICVTELIYLKKKVKHNEWRMVLKH